MDASFGQNLILFITLFLMLIGLIFTIIPPIPGTLIIWGAAIFYGLVVGWGQLGWWTFGLLTVLMVVGIIVDILAGHFGAKLGGASCLAIFVGAVLGIVLGIGFSFIGSINKNLHRIIKLFHRDSNFEFACLEILHYIQDNI